MWSGAQNRGRNPSNGNSSGPYFCDYIFPNGVLAGARCTWSGRSALDLTLHKSDRHLIYPPGGPAALEALDPILIAEKNEQRRRARRAKSSAPVQGGEDGDALAVLSGLTVKLDTPELLQQWISERKKRWPTLQAVERKRIEDEWRGRDPPRNQRPRQPAPPAPPAPSTHQVDQFKGKAPLDKAASPSSDSDDSDTSSDSDPDSSVSSSDSDSDGPPEEEVTLKAPPRPELPAPAEPDGLDSDDAPVEESTTKSSIPPLAPSAPSSTRRVCKFWSSGNGCGQGTLCRDEHPTPDQMKVREKRPAPATSQQPPKRPRRRPAPPPSNPFAQPDLLRALLAREIAQHVDSTIQAIRFLAKNNWLVQVEMEPGIAEAQRKRRGLVQPLESPDSTVAQPPSEIPQTPQVDTQPTTAPMEAPWGDGNVHVVPSIDRPGAMTLQRTASPLLRPLTDLEWPPEPDPLIFLDPMARDEPKPLKVEQYQRLASDPEVRTILAPKSDLHPYGRLNQSLTRGLQSLLDLPTQSHRVSAIELILGTAEQGPSIAGPATGSAVGRSRYTEQDLFRLGLKLGPMEVPLVRALATRVSDLLDGSVAYADDTSRRQTQEEKWRAEGERRDELRRMGIDLD